MAKDDQEYKYMLNLKGGKRSFFRAAMIGFLISLLIEDHKHQ